MNAYAAFWNSTKVWTTKWRKFRDLRYKTVRLLSQMNFLRKCDKNNIFPQVFHIPYGIFKNKCARIIETTRTKLLKAAIRDLRAKIGENELYCYCLYQDLVQNTPEVIFHHLMVKILHKISIIEENEKEKHCRKFLFLNAKQNKIQKNHNPLKIPFVNLSGIPLPKDISDFLSSGPKFSINKSPSNVEIISDVESAILRTPKHIQAILRNKIAYHLIKFDNCADKSINKIIIKLKKFIKNNQLAICKADKTGQIVIIKQEDLKAKAEIFLNENKCEKISDYNIDVSYNAILRISKLKNIKDFLGNISPPSDYSIPRLFIQLKLHKENQPIRPLVNMSKAPSVNLERILAKKCKPIINLPTRITSSEEFISRLPKSIDPNTTMFTLDVVSLFPSVPVFEAHMLLVKNIIDHYNIPGPLIKNLYDALFTIRENSIFQFNHQFYKQTKGLPMGSPLSPILAEIYMQQIEKSKIMNAEFQPLLWLRYVDDIFVLWQHGKENLEKLLNNITNEFPTIKFTINEEEAGNITFLDVNISRFDNNNLKCSVYHKNSCPILIPFNSYTPMPYKMSALHYYIKRAHNYCTSELDTKKELEFIQKVALKHKFPPQLVSKMSRKLKKPQVNLQPECIKPELKYVGSTTYVQNLSQKIQNIFKNQGFRFIVKPPPNIFTIVKNDRDPVDPLKCPGVYIIPISNDDDNTAYIGSTTRSIKTRLEEHKKDILHKRDCTSLSQYILQNSHALPQWEKVRNIVQINDYIKLRYRESLEIILKKNCNLETPYKVPYIWRSLIIFPDKIDHEVGNDLHLVDS